MLDVLLASAEGAKMRRGVTDGGVQEQLKESASQLAAVQRNYESLSRIMQQRQNELEAVGQVASPCQWQSASLQSCIEGP